MEILSTALLLFLVLDPIGNIPAYLAVLHNVPAERRRWTVIRELLVALVALILFLFLGQYILTILQVSQGSLGVAGGIVLFLIALRLVFPTQGGVFGHESNGEPFIVPLAIPLIAGPAAMAILMLLMAREPGKWPQWLAALLLAWTVSGIILLLASRLADLLGRRTLSAIERLMGLILITVAVEMLIDGIAQAYAAVPQSP